MDLLGRDEGQYWRPTVVPEFSMEFGDIAPSQPIHDAVTALVENLRLLTKAWTTLQDKDLKSLNEQLTKAGIPALPVAGK